jgi:hypothetical protein
MRLLRGVISTGIILSAAYVGGQDGTSPKPNSANGIDGTYSNECLALRYRLPEGWEFAKSNQGKANDPKKQMRLFRVQRQSAAGLLESLSVDVLNTPLQHPNMERFTILLALSFVHLDSSKNKITRNAFPVTIAGRSFYRSDLSHGDEAASMLATWYRGYAVTAAASADSPQDLEDVTNALSGLSFGEDKRTADCFDSTN